MSKIIQILIAGALAAQVSAQSPAQKADALYREGVAFEKAGDPAAAQKAYASAVATNPEHATARYKLGQVKIDAGAISAKAREAKFGAVVIPAVQFEEATLQEALTAVGKMIEKESKEEVMPNFVVQDPQGRLAAAKITIQLKNVPAKAVMDYILTQSSAKARYDEHAVVIVPR